MRSRFVGRLLRARARRYARLARLDRPIGWLLLLWPFWWSSALAINWVEAPFPVPVHLLLFLIGAIAIRGASCTYSDIVDRKIDAKFARTRTRPVPSGQVSVRGALVFLLVQALIGLAVLVQFGVFTILLCFASLGTIVIYLLLRRFTNWPQVGLGLAYAWGALMGWVALLGDVAWSPILLYLGCVFWVIGYATIYALQDEEDDTLAGFRSVARLPGARARAVIALCYACTTILLAASFWMAEAEIVAYVGLGLGALHLGWQVATLDADSPERSLRLFRSNRDYGWIIFLGIVFDAMLTARW
jgi:4-hydroxybenzoate polyprenyltransferase